MVLRDASASKNQNSNQTLALLTRASLFTFPFCIFICFIPEESDMRQGKRGDKEASWQWRPPQPQQTFWSLAGKMLWLICDGSESDMKWEKNDKKTSWQWRPPQLRQTFWSLAGMIGVMDFRWKFQAMSGHINQIMKSASEMWVK